MNHLHTRTCPFPDYDYIPLGTLPSRIASLDESAVSGLLAFEQAHGNRLPAVQVLERRVEALRAPPARGGGDRLWSGRSRARLWTSLVSGDGAV